MLGETVANIYYNALLRFLGFDDATLDTYYSSLTEVNVLCIIKDLTTDQYYDYFDLTFYRVPDCESITYAEYDVTAASRAEYYGYGVSLPTIEVSQVSEWTVMPLLFNCLKEPQLQRFGSTPI